MTPEQGKTAVQRRGYTWTIAGPCYYRVNRAADSYAYVEECQLEQMAEQTFIEFIERQFR